MEQWNAMEFVRLVTPDASQPSAGYLQIPSLFHSGCPVLALQDSVHLALIS